MGNSRVRIIVAVVAAMALAFTIWLLWRISKARRVEAYRLDMVAAGFPESYAERLALLKYEHNKWVFVPMPIDDLKWGDIVRKECTASWNLVSYSKWAPDEWRDLGVTNYTPYYAENAKAYDSGAWYQASEKAIAYFMDPRNFINERDVFMFETLGFDGRSQTHDAVERALSTTFMSKACYDGGTRKFSELIMEVGKKLGVSPVFLAGRLASEQGSGSVQARGTIGDSLVELYTNTSDRVGNAIIWGKNYTLGSASTTAVMAKGKATYNGYYNFFNFRAYGLGLFEIRYNAWREATSKETCEKYLGPWNTQARAIEGGSIKIKEMYVDTHRHTRYLQKFSVSPKAGKFRWKQYMQNIAAPLIEARNTSKAYEAVDALDEPYRFIIPVYKSMPGKPSEDPAQGRSVYSPSR